LQWTLVYSPADIVAISASAGAAATAAGVELWCAASPGAYTCLLAGLNANIIENGVVAVVTATISPNTTATAINIANALGATQSASADPIAATGGTITTVVPLSLTSLSCNPNTLASGASTTCTVSLNQSAPSGTTVTLSDNNPLLAIPASVSVPPGAASAIFVATAAVVTANQSASVTAALNGALQSATLSLVAPTLVSTLACNPTSIDSGAATTCTVTLSQAAPSGGSAVALSSNNAALTVPASVSVPANSTATTFAATLGTITANQPATITAALYGASQGTTLSLVAPTLVSSFACNPTSVDSGATTTCTVTLSQPAPSGGTVVALSGNNPLLTIPASLTVSAGATSGSFTATAGAIATSLTVTLTAALNSASQTASVLVVPTVAVSAVSCNPSSLTAGSSSTCTVDLNRVAVNPQTVELTSDGSLLTIPASVSFPAAVTSATFTATAGDIPKTRGVTITAYLHGSTTTTLSLQPLLSTLACTLTSLDAGSAGACTVTLANPAPAEGVAVAVSSDGPALTVPAAINISPASSTATFPVTASSAPAGQSTVTVTAALYGASLAASFTVTICPCSVFSASAAPANPDANDNQAIEVGMQFVSHMSGYVTGVRFYKGIHNTGTHVGHLWSPKGKLLAAVTFTDETASGWQLAYFPSPVAVTAKDPYVISYNAPNGNYAADNGFFTNALNNAPLGGLADGENGPNGVYQYGSGGFPTTGATATNYWVDLIFNTSPTIGTAAPVSLWTPEAAPNTAAAQTAQATQLGLTFMSSVPGYATGLRFYKSSTNLGPHQGYLWTITGTLLGSVVFTNESASGWQQANFATPVAIDANKPYVVSYWAPEGQFADDAGYFATSGVTNQMLYTPSDGQYGPNGSHGSTNAFPASPSGSANYWVDVVFTTAIQ
jgi:hypothetical protein